MHNLESTNDDDMISQILSGEPFTPGNVAKLAAIGATLATQGTVAQSIPATYCYKGLTLSEGTWLVCGNAFLDTNSATSAGYIKAALSTSKNSFSKYNTTQNDRGSEADTGMGVSPILVTVPVGKTDVVYINATLELHALVTGTWYLRVMAVRLV